MVGISGQKNGHLLKNGHMDTPNTTPSEQTNPTSPKTELPFSVTSTDTTTYTSEPSEGRWLYPLLVAALILLVAGGFFAWKSLNHASDNGLPEDIASTSTASNGSNANLAIVPPASNATGTGTAANTTWNLYSFTLGGHAISFQIPSGHHAYLDGNQVVVVPDLTEENDSPLPDMTIRLFPNMTLENLKKIDQQKRRKGFRCGRIFPCTD